MYFLFCGVHRLTVWWIFLLKWDFFTTKKDGSLGPLPWKVMGHILKSWENDWAHHKSEGLQITGINKTVLMLQEKKWAWMQENLSSGVCEQQRRRPACASAQSDQCLCYSLFEKYHVKACYKRNFKFLASLCSWGDWFESHFVWNPEDRFCRDEAQILSAVYDLIIEYFSNSRGDISAWSSSLIRPTFWSSIKMKERGMLKVPYS